MIIEYLLCARWPHLIVTVNYEIDVTISILQMRNHSRTMLFSTPAFTAPVFPPMSFPITAFSSVVSR